MVCLITRVKAWCGELDHDACRVRKAKSWLGPAHPWGYYRVVKDSSTASPITSIPGVDSQLPMVTGDC